MRTIEQTQEMIDQIEKQLADKEETYTLLYEALDEGYAEFQSEVEDLHREIQELRSQRAELQSNWKED